MFDKNYFLSRLQNGEKIEDIGNEIAAMMNEAVAEQQAAEAKAKAEAEAKVAQAKTDARKVELMEQMVDIVKEYATLEGVEGKELEVSAEDIDQLVNAFNEMFAVMREMKTLVAKLEEKHPIQQKHIVPNDDQILADFIKMFG